MIIAGLSRKGMKENDAIKCNKFYLKLQKVKAAPDEFRKQPR